MFKTKRQEPLSSLGDEFDKLVESATIIDDENDVDDYALDYWEEERRKERQRENLENIGAAGISAVISRLSCHPFDVIKRRLQRTPTLAHRSASRTLLHVAKLIYVERGARGLWKGHGRAQFLGILQTVTLFLTYEHLRVQLDFTSGMAPHPVLCCYTAGVLSGATVVLLIHPLEVIKTRREAYNRMVHQFGARKASQQLLPLGGWRGCYRGLLPSLVHVSSLYGFKFLIYNTICEHLMADTDFEQRYELEGLSLAAAGALSGVLSNVLIYPLDSIKQRLMATGLDRQRYKFDSTCRRIVQCSRVIWQREGLFGLYNGLVPCMLRSAVNTAVQFSVFDSVIQKLRDWTDEHD